MTQRSGEARPLTTRQKEAIRAMDEIVRQYGKVFVQNSLHRISFEYRALERIAEGIDP